MKKRRRRKKEDDENVFFKALGKKFFVNIKKLFMTNLLSYRLHEKVIICYIIKGRLDVQFVNKTPVEMVICQQMEK